MKKLPIIKENEIKDSPFVDFWAFEMEFRLRGRLEYVRDVLPVRSLRTASALMTY